MADTRLDTLQVGDALPALQLAPISRTTLALYAGASGDHNPIHIDSDFAKAAGLDDVFAHGMLSVAYLGRLVSNWAGQRRMRRLSVRFTAITHLQDAPLCTGKIVERFQEDGEERLRLDIQCANQHGDIKLSGNAIVAVF